MEWATTPQQREHGLSGRASLPDDHGLLFVFDKPDDACFWMKDMRFDIDIIWLDATRHVVKVQESATPASYPATFCPSQAAQYVLEVHAGLAQRSGVQVGTYLRW